MKIHIATISHKFGLNTYAAVSTDELYEKLREYVRENHDMMRHPIEDEKMSAREVVTAYFEDEDVMFEEFLEIGDDNVKIPFIEQMAGMSTPEEETDEDVDEYVADLDEERLWSEYHAFMEMVRAAKELV